MTKLPTYEEAAEIVEAYRGKRRAVFDDLGDVGLRAVYVIADGSPTTAAEFLGYAPSSNGLMGRRFQKAGLPSRRRDTGQVAPPFRRFERDKELDEVRATYLSDTSGAEKALEHRWKLAPGTEYARLITVSDLHYGHQAMDYSRWLKLRDWIGENPDVRWLFHGDLFDMATVQSPGKSMIEQGLSFDAAVRLAVDDIRPIAPQCVGLLTGNHDQRIARGLQIDYDPVREVARTLIVEHLGYEGFVKYIVTAGKRRQAYIGYHHHGIGSGQTWGSVFNSLQRLANANKADFVVMGHRHQLAAIQQMQREVAANNELRMVDVPLVCAGSFLKHEGGSYSVEKGYAPAVLGAATLHLYLDRHSVHARA